MRLKIVSVLAFSGLMCMGGIIIANEIAKNCDSMTSCSCHWGKKKCHSKCTYLFDHNQWSVSCVKGQQVCDEVCRVSCLRLNTKKNCNSKSYPHE